MNSAIKVVFGIIVLILAVWILNKIVISSDNNNQDKIYNNFKNACGVILQQQPKNVSLYDDCMNTGVDNYQP